MTRIGVVGGGRVGAVLAAALRSAGHEISAVAGESDASRTRIETLLPGVRVDKPTAVARSCDLLLLTVPDDMLGNVAEWCTDDNGNHLTVVIWIALAVFVISAIVGLSMLVSIWWRSRKVHTRR